MNSQASSTLPIRSWLPLKPAFPPTHQEYHQYLLLVSSHVPGMLNKLFVISVFLLLPLLLFLQCLSVLFLLSYSLHILHALDDHFGLYFESHVTYSCHITFSFLNLAQTWNLWSSTIFRRSVILLPSFLIHKYFSKFLSLHDFANPASLFLYSQLNSDLSIMFLYEVHFWGIFYWYFATFNKHCYKDRKKDRRISLSHHFADVSKF